MNEPLKILVIDDSEDDRMLYRRALEKSMSARYSIIEADDGESGIAAIDTGLPDCILLDYSMPGYDGLAILKRIRSTFPFIPVIMLTGQGNEKVAVNAMQEGAQNYISKSFITTETLEHVIRMAIEHCLMEKRIYEQRTSLEVFTRALAHDLKEPIRTIRSFTEMIIQNETFSSEKIAGYFQHIYNASVRMQMLIDMVFLYTRLNDPSEIAKEDCDMEVVLEEVKENLSTLLVEHRAVITADPLPKVHANKMQMIQILQNLLSNAISHNQEKTTIHITAEEQEEDWLFRVSDNGKGIDSNYLQRIFEPFKRLVRDEKGAGLGLAICKKIIESHGGKIWCESAIGKGSTFLFTLSKALENKQSSTEPVLSSVEVCMIDNSLLANVLLVDDRKSDLELIRIRMIELPHLRCNLFVATNGEEALELLRDKEHPIDLMLLDINMPEMDGFEMIEHMSEEQRRQTAIVMCTGSTYDKDMARAKSLGAIGYIVKPGEFALLKSLIETMPHLQLRPEKEGYRLFRGK